jgi:acyl-CoA synthetase (AMP-forming)/AMP-acid ligase II
LALGNGGTATLTIPELFEASIERFAASPWLTFEDSTFSFGQAHARVCATAAALRELGIDREARVLATTRNSPEYLFTWLALMRLGAVLLPVNPAGSASELGGFLRQTQPQVIVTDVPRSTRPRRTPRGMERSSMSRTSSLQQALHRRSRLARTTSPS